MKRRQLLAALGAMPLAAQSVPRPAEDLEITFTNGRKTRLSQYKGKVLAFACILTT
jgi:hypothetical protein